MTRIGVGIVIADKEGVLTDVSPIAAALLNTEKEQLIGKTPEKTSAFVRQLLLTKDVGYIQIASSAGKKRNCWIESYPFLGKDGTKGGTFWIICDATKPNITLPNYLDMNITPEKLNNKQDNLTPSGGAETLGEHRDDYQGCAKDNFHLTQRQLQVLVLIADGNTYKEVATCLGIGKRTVKYHVQSAIDKLRLQNRLQLISYIAKSGLLK